MTRGIVRVLYTIIFIKFIYTVNLSVYYKVSLFVRSHNRSKIVSILITH